MCIRDRRGPENMADDTDDRCGPSSSGWYAFMGRMDACDSERSNDMRCGSPTPAPMLERTLANEARSPALPLSILLRPPRLAAADTTMMGR